MQKADTLIRTKMHLPFTRPDLVSRPRLRARIREGLRGPLTLITAPAGFGKTSLVASFITDRGMPVAWLSLDEDDNQVERFLNYLVAALQEADHTIGSEAAQLLAATQGASPEAVLTSLVNDLDTTGEEVVLVLDDYQFISSQAVHEGVAFTLRHCPKTFHLVIATRSDPPLPLTRLRARGQTVELRAGDLRFTELEAAQFLNEVMNLGLDAGSVSTLAERTEGWIAGLQMAALSLRDREDVLGFIEGFSGTNRYILDYLLEEVLANQPREIQGFLLTTSILGRLSAPLCDAVLAHDAGSVGEGDHQLTLSESPFAARSASILEHLEGANLFLVPLDDERIWYRYHHLFADLLRAQLQKSIGAQGVALVHLRAAEWHEQNGSILEAIQHASMASDDEMVERLIEQHYMEMVNRGEMYWVRFWMGKLSKDLIYRRPWLCLYEALSRSWFGQLEEASLLLDAAEKRIQSATSGVVSTPEARTMLGYHAFVKSRVTAMQGDTRRAIELCASAREYIPADNLALQNEVGITLGYEYFLYGDFANANETLHETIRSGYIARAINNPVAAYALLARMQFFKGRLHEAYDLLQKAAQLIREAGGQHLGAKGLVEVEIATLLCEWNVIEDALIRLKQGLDCLPWWGKADDLCLAYATLSRIQLAQGNQVEAAETIEKAVQIIQTCGVFSEARKAVQAAQIKVWLAHGDWPSIHRWAASFEKGLGLNDSLRFEDELTHITQARVFIAQNKSGEAIKLLSQLEGAARSAGRMGRVIEMTLLQALTLREIGDSDHAILALTKCLTLAQPEGYVRIFLDEGRSMQTLLTQWLVDFDPGPLRDYAIHLLSQFEAEPGKIMPAQRKASPADSPVEPEVRQDKDMLVEPLSPRELEVLQLIATGRTNREIAEQLIIAPGTVKAHSASIYRKLDVANRTEAAARARQLGILP